MVFLAISLLTSALARAECVPAKETVNFRHTGHYHRVHPSGNYVLYTDNGVKIVDITNRAEPKLIETPMKNETYPVEGPGGGWELLASPYHSDGMNYFQFKDILAKGATASAVYHDPKNDQYYHSSAELPGSSASTKKVRTLLYGNTYREYTMRKDAKGNFTKVEAGPAAQQACLSISGTDGPDRTLSPEDMKKLQALRVSYLTFAEELEKIGSTIDPLNDKFKATGSPDDNAKLQKAMKAYEQAWNRTQKVQEDMNTFVNGSKFKKIFARSKELEERYMSASTETQRSKIQEEMQKIGAELNAYYSTPAHVFSNPVLSKDGTLVATSVSGGINVYRIKEGGRCERVGAFEQNGSKVSFSYPESGKLPRIVFTTQQGASGNFRASVVIYDLSTKESTTISDGTTDAYYPGFTRDGRVIYAGNAGFTIVDPVQAKNGAGARGCVQARYSSPDRGATGEETGGRAAE